MAAPRPVCRRSDHSCPHWVQDDITRKLEKIAFLLHKNCLVPTLEKVSHERVATIELLGIVSHVNAALLQPHWRSHEALLKKQVKPDREQQ